MALLWWRRSRLPDVEEAVGFVVFTALAVASARNLLWWSLFVPPVVGGLVRPSRERDADTSPLAPLVAIALAGLLVLGLVRVAVARPSASLLTEAPLGITSALERVAGPNDLVFDGWWGSWFENADPGLPMFVDARAELFPPFVWDDFFRVSSAAVGWDSTLHRWRIDVIVASWDHQAFLIATLDADARWRSVYRDADGVVYVRA